MIASHLHKAVGTVIAGAGQPNETKPSALLLKYGIPMKTSYGIAGKEVR
jgi:hypothetical protein